MKNQLIAALFLLTASALWAAPPADVQAQVDKEKAILSYLSTDPVIVAEVKAANTNPVPEAKGMTNEKWAGLTVISPEVKAFTKCKLASYLKSKKPAEVSEIFVSAADGSKVAFLTKPSNWTHKGKPKHENPMTKKAWTGDVEQDESTGKKQVQFAIPILDAGKPIGSIVIGLSLADIK